VFVVLQWTANQTEAMNSKIKKANGIKNTARKKRATKESNQERKRATQKEGTKREGKTGRQTDRQTDRQTEREREREREREPFNADRSGAPTDRPMIIVPSQTSCCQVQTALPCDVR